MLCICDHPAALNLEKSKTNWNKKGTKKEKHRREDYYTPVTGERHYNHVNFIRN